MNMAINKEHIAGSFSRAAQSYDAHAALQREVADKLLHKVDDGRPAMRILDLGSGTGYASPMLQARFPETALLSVDIAPGMLAYARDVRGIRGDFLCADAERLPLLTDSVGLIYSSLAIQWCSDYRALFAELCRVARPGSQCLLSTFGPTTLQELKAAWACVDDGVHVNDFASPAVLLAALQGLPVEDVTLQVDNLSRNYAALSDLSRELKAIGAHNMNAGQARGLTGKDKLKRLQAAFMAEAGPAGRAVTWELAYLSFTVGAAKAAA